VAALKFLAPSASAERNSRDSLVEGALGLESGDGGALPVERTLGAIWPNRLTLGKAGWCDRKCQ